MAERHADIRGTRALSHCIHAYITMKTAILRCRVAAKWYRFTSRVTDHMPETCVEPGHCGTQWPIWMNAQHPTGNTQITIL